VALLAASYVGARLVSWVLGRAVMAAQHRNVDVRLLQAFKRPLTYALFLVGVHEAIARLPLPPPWDRRTWSPLFVFGALLLTLALSRSFSLVLQWYVSRPHRLVDPEAAREWQPLFQRAGQVFISLVALIAVLQHFGVNVASLVVSLGVGSLALGLAAQDTLSNMFAGFTLMLDRPFRVGDRIQLATGEVGDVESIGMRSTLIKTADDTLLVVPNSLLVKERLVNLSRPARHLSAKIEVSVPYGTDVERARTILAEAVSRSPHVDPQRPPAVHFTRLGEFAITLQVVFWALDFARLAPARSDAYAAVYGALAEAGIAPPGLGWRLVQDPSREAR
jgi:small-conductance mechanosensitive channel